MKLVESLEYNNWSATGREGEKTPCRIATFVLAIEACFCSVVGRCNEVIAGDVCPGASWWCVSRVRACDVCPGARLWCVSRGARAYPVPWGLSNMSFTVSETLCKSTVGSAGLINVILLLPYTEFYSSLVIWMSNVLEILLCKWQISFWHDSWNCGIIKMCKIQYINNIIT